MNELLNEIKSVSCYKDLLSQVENGLSGQSLYLPRSARIPLLASLFSDHEQTILLITGRTDQALHYLEELNYWLPEAQKMLFPEPNPLFYERAAWGTTNRRERLRVITKLGLQHIPVMRKRLSPMIVVAPVRALMTRMLPRREFIKATRQLKLSQRIQPMQLLRDWLDLGYQPVDVVLEPGQYTSRGGIVDIWSPAEGLPVRIEFFGDEIDTLRVFEPASQRTVSQVEQVTITPAREVLPLHANMAGIDTEALDEFDIPLVYQEKNGLLDYLSNSVLVILDDQEYMQTISDDVEDQALRMRDDAIKEGILSADYPVPYLTWSELNDSLSRQKRLDLSSNPDSENAVFGACFTSGPRFGGRIKPFLEFLTEELQSNNKLYLVSRQMPRLRELWSEHEQNAAVDHQPVFLEGILREGWILQKSETEHIFLLTDGEIFGWEHLKPRTRPKQASEAPETSFEDLRIADWVVHVDYGIGQYAGLVKRTLDGAEREFLLVEFADGDQLYVPIHQSDRLSRYIGPSGAAPSATRLGTAEWSQAKTKVKEAVEEVARDLLELYSKRQQASGYAFQPDTPWQKEMEDSFPYIETIDQLNAINEVKNDMEEPRPMDRLICGDVGYGKTEVAIRAAFKAVMESKQVAVLVPTTVLAQQHYETFRQRMVSFPIEVEMLSRFRSVKEQDAIIKRLQKGEVDIVIGTHRLLQNDVLFKDLGLVIIDEEQRFGVTHKEHFKKLRTEVDVLTMTATPIPRTLYMALTGVRDISNINTPPEERLPVITHIGPYSPKLVRHAIMREMERGGQVFMVHNRVQTIYGMKEHLKQLVPEARIGVAHGQMHEKDLSSAMKQFTQGEIDVLLCTSIIESGLDIPNANTLIVDRGDAFGLAQLYQLRGRVGRGAQRAYAYFFKHNKKAPTPEGQERLETIAENTQLGAGYSIAMRDLEMRGAGDMLGIRQHGYIASVGFHLYTRMLAHAVKDVRESSNLPEVSAKEIVVKEIKMPITVELPLAVGIPVDYVADQNLRLGLYRRIATLETAEDIDAMQAEFEDRFGQAPIPVLNFFYQIRVKQLAEKIGLASVSLENDQLVLRFPPLPEGQKHRNLPAVRSDIRAGRNAYWIAVSEGQWQDQLIDVLQELVKFSINLSSLVPALAG